MFIILSYFNINDKIKILHFIFIKLFQKLNFKNYNKLNINIQRMKKKLFHVK